MTGSQEPEVPMTAEPDRHIRRLAAQLRVDSIRCSTQAGSGHATSSLSAADLMAVLLDRHLHYDWDRPSLPTNDHLIFSKGHASPLLYAMYRAVGVVGEDELIRTYRQFGGRLQGHPTPALPWVDVATGSLGQGLPDAVGVALAGRYLDRLPYRTWVLCGDSELAEGSIWEALDKAAYYKLGNLTAIVDVNRLGQDGPTELQWDMERYARRVEAFGALPLIVDGHDVAAIDDAFTRALSRPDQPTVILARTIKGKGVPEIEDRNGWHGKALPKEMADRAVGALGGPSNLRITTALPAPGVPALTPNPQAAISLPRWEVGEEVATRAAFGAAVSALAARPEVVVLDGEVGNSTHAGEFEKAAPERYFEMFIAEQQLIASAVGLSVRGYIAFASSFAAFLISRPFDFIRMAGVSQVSIRLVGTHAGVEIGQDGPSQMALEDIAAMRAVHTSSVLYPADAPSTAYLVKTMADTPGISYLRATRGAYPVIYGPDEQFPLGGCKVHHSGPEDAVTLVGAGVTLHECLTAADQLAAEGINARVIDLYSIKPIDTRTLLRSCQETGGRIVIAEDHYPEGGIGAAVLETLAGPDTPELHATLLAVKTLPTSGTPQELLDAAGISARHITDAARNLLRTQ
ncbi:transketolase [Arthrobacter sp. PvP102]|uniref:transketolase n=1 Tax=unclassified Arthrobacter TaxID=235627 RepID=UPI001B48FED9|nr:MULTISPECIES: transketolase [unclassified Arthrobacter]MBP1235232.1 transketolase [Arthrobacter sp. PvP103]MBP1236191.1 transketolase [Arthrobacter sp. PvP102]